MSDERRPAETDLGDVFAKDGHDRVWRLEGVRIWSIEMGFASPDRPPRPLPFSWMRPAPRSWFMLRQAEWLSKQGWRGLWRATVLVMRASLLEAQGR